MNKILVILSSYVSLVSAVTAAPFGAVEKLHVPFFKREAYSNPHTNEPKQPLELHAVSEQELAPFVL